MLESIDLYNLVCARLLTGVWNRVTIYPETIFDHPSFLLQSHLEIMRNGEYKHKERMFAKASCPFPSYALGPSISQEARHFDSGESSFM